MPATASPYGLIPVNHPSGVVRPFAMTIASAYGTNIFQNQPVAIDATNGTIVVPAASAAIIGSFQGVEFTDAEGRRRVSNRWLASTVATDIVAYVTIDQTITYQIQGNGGASANTALTVADIGSQYDYTTAAGNSAGFSTIALDQATATTSATKQLRLIGIVPGPNNVFGDNTLPFVDALVQISEHQNTANIVAY